MKYFRAYRYHPDFVKDVKDGYRSLTYSHAIEPLRTLCPYEAAGGVCHDTTCEYQHWRDIILPGALNAWSEILKPTQHFFPPSFPNPVKTVMGHALTPSEFWLLCRWQDSHRYGQPEGRQDSGRTWRLYRGVERAYQHIATRTGERFFHCRKWDCGIS